MNKNYKETLSKVTGPMNETIASVLDKLRPDPEEKEGVSLVNITKKLTEKKFGKKK